MLIRDCIEAVSTAFDVSVSDLRGGSRKHRVSQPRQAAMLLARWEGHSTTKIGRELGGRDNTTVGCGSRAAERRYDTDEEYGDRLQAAWLNLQARTP